MALMPSATDVGSQVCLLVILKLSLLLHRLFPPPDSPFTAPVPPPQSASISTLLHSDFQRVAPPRLRLLLPRQLCLLLVRVRHKLNQHNVPPAYSRIFQGDWIAPMLRHSEQFQQGRSFILPQESNRDRFPRGDSGGVLFSPAPLTGVNTPHRPASGPGTLTLLDPAGPIEGELK